MYMGEIARRVIVKCVNIGCLFNGQLSDELNTPHRFYTKYVSEIEKYDRLFTKLSVYIYSFVNYFRKLPVTWLTGDVVECP